MNVINNPVPEKPSKSIYGEYDLQQHSDSEQTCVINYFEWTLRITDERLVSMLNKLETLGKCCKNEKIRLYWYDHVYLRIDQAISSIRKAAEENQSYETIEEIFNETIAYVYNNSYIVEFVYKDILHGCPFVGTKSFPSKDEAMEFLTRLKNKQEEWSNPLKKGKIIKIDFFNQTKELIYELKPSK